MNLHADIAPSSLDLTEKCIGSVQMQKRVPQLPDTEEQAKGKFMHVVCMYFAQGKQYKIGEVIQFEGRAWTITRQMLDHAKLYAGELGVGIGSVFEEPISIKRIHPSKCWGTPDYRRYIPEVPMLKTVDYKNGHRYVEVWESPQGVAYLTGIGDTLEIPDSVPTVFAVVQPNCYSAEPVREWRSTMGYVRELAATKYADIAARALAPNPPTTAGSHCLDCRAVHECATAQRAAERVVQYAGTAEPLERDPTQVGMELMMLEEAIDILQARADGLKGHAEALLRNGNRVHGYKLDSGSGRQVWLDAVTDRELHSLEILYNLKLFKAPERLTPTQAKLEGLDPAMLDKFSHKARGKTHVTRENMLDATKAFANGK